MPVKNHRSVVILILVLVLILAGMLLYCPGKAQSAATTTCPTYKEPMNITLMEYGSLSPYMTIEGLDAEGDSSVASEYIAVTSGLEVAVYSLRTRERIFSSSYREQEVGGTRGYGDPVTPCRLSPDGKKLALILRKAQRVDIFDIASGKVQSVAIAEPRLFQWSNKGEFLLIVSGKQKLHIISFEKGQKNRVLDLIPPGGVEPVFERDYKVYYIHLMPDNRTLYFKSAFICSSGLYGMDLETGALYKLRDQESMVIHLSSDNQYLFYMSWSHPGDGYISIGHIVTAEPDKLDSKSFVKAYTGDPSPAFAALGPWCAFSMDIVRTPGSDEYPSTIELLYLPGNRLLRLVINVPGEVLRLFFSPYRQMFIVDMKVKNKRVISVLYPRDLLNSHPARERHSPEKTQLFSGKTNQDRDRYLAGPHTLPGDR